MEEPLALFFCAEIGEEIMKLAPEHLINLIEPVVEGLGYECVGIDYNPHPRHGLLRIYIDNDNGILLDDCTRVSHQVGGVLDVEDPISGNYQLEISSPGEDRPFYKISQFERFIGSTVMVSLYAPIQGRKKIKGVIEKVNGEIISLNDSGQIFAVPFSAMSKARLVPLFNSINSGIEKGARNGK